MSNSFIIPYSKLTNKDVPIVGGKNASLGEMMHHLIELGIAIPDGFAVTVKAYHEFLTFNTLAPLIQNILNRLNRQTLDNLTDISQSCRELILKSSFPKDVEAVIKTAYEDLLKKYGANLAVAVRSSATAEDSPTASFAGQHDSFLNITGSDQVIDAVKRCYASLFNDRAIKYRLDNGFSDMQVGQSVGVQMMVRSDKGSAGVAFTIEPENGNKNLIYITGAWGLGESVVQGAVNTDEFYIFKPGIGKFKNTIVHRHLGSKQQMLIYGANGKTTEWKETSPALRDQYVLSDEEIQLLSSWCLGIETHYGLPMDIEWAKDGITGNIFIVQARPETVHGQRKKISIKEYKLLTKKEPLLSGKAVGRSIISGNVCIVRSLADANKVKKGDIIVADITNPDWNTMLLKAICIVTNKGGRTSHASIVARELGISAVVGTQDATEKLHDNQLITVSCENGDIGFVYDGKLDWNTKETLLESIGETETKPMLILADPLKSLMYATYPNQGVGLLRMEFAINNSVQIHPMALVNFSNLPSGTDKKQIEALTRRYTDKKQFFIDTLAEALGLVGAAFYPKEVIVRMSDFKTNEYSKLLGGKPFEPEEENPMLGFRGASRYYNERYREGFGLECQAIKKVRNEMGLSNIKVMIPFCRTPEEGKRVLQTMKEFGLSKGDNGLEVYVMAEIPSNIILAREFAKLFDGFSIGSNDLTQLTLGLDRDSAIVSNLFDENNEAVTSQIKHLIEVAHQEGVKVGLCGQAPSDYPEFAKLLVSQGIDTISFNPDAILQGIENILAAEKTSVLA